MERVVFLDLETTGRSAAKDKIIEIGMVEIIDRRITGKEYHQYVNPEQEVEAGAEAVHGMNWDSLKGYPVYAEVHAATMAFVDDSPAAPAAGAEETAAAGAVSTKVVAHNAPFDIGFLDAEIDRLKLGMPSLYEVWNVQDSLKLARAKRPKMRNSLDALMEAFHIEVDRTKHGALVDAQILAKVWLWLTGGQERLELGAQGQAAAAASAQAAANGSANARSLPVRTLNDEERQTFNKYQDELRKISQSHGVDGLVWDDKGEPPGPAG